MEDGSYKAAQRQRGFEEMQASVQGTVMEDDSRKPSPKAAPISGISRYLRKTGEYQEGMG